MKQCGRSSLDSGLILLPRIREPVLLICLFLKVAHGEAYPKTMPSSIELEPFKVALLVRVLLGLQLYPSSKELSYWANMQLVNLDSYKEFRDPKVSR